MELFFNTNADKNENEISFDDFESKHILRAKRKKNGDEIHFTNGKGDLFKGVIIKSKPRVVTNCQLINHIEAVERKITLAVGFIKSNRLDFLIEKITEIGINKIILFSSENCNYYSDKIDRFRKITRQAIKQSLRYYLPEIETIKNFDSLVKESSGYDNKYVTDQTAQIGLSEIMNQIKIEKTNNIIYIIGPEGGLSEKEIELAITKGFVNVNLGQHRLRTETAALVFGSYLNVAMN
jgi:16S rRNA (uracil1498-N3)-methyltransferase